MKLKKGDRLIIVATHLMEEAEMCDEVIILSQGEYIIQGSPAELKKSYQKEIIQVRMSGISGEKLVVDFEGFLNSHLSPTEKYSKLENFHYRIEVDANSTLLQKINENYRHSIASMEWGPATMSDIYFHYTGKSL